MEEIKKAKLKDLIQDDRNLNKGTERGQELIEDTTAKALSYKVRNNAP